jgi:catechol 2,3-dioxygenase-like lactoylglutathione lyase family enzyme
VTPEETPPALRQILETVLYYAPEEEAEVERFYGELLGLRSIGRKKGRFLFFRLGAGVLLLFNREASLRQDSPPPHGASGPGHTCFVVESADYPRWKQRLAAAGVAVEDETRWPGGGRSFYFVDPAGNQLEIADRDIWPG